MNIATNISNKRRIAYYSLHINVAWKKVKEEVSKQ